jgi:hypothetical protein
VIRSGSWHVGEYRLQTSELTARVLTQRFERDKDERDFSYATCTARVTENVLQVKGPRAVETEAFRSRRKFGTQYLQFVLLPSGHTTPVPGIPQHAVFTEHSLAGRVLDVAE